MARKRYSEEDIQKLLREIELKLAESSDVQTDRRAVGGSDASYENWRRRFGALARSQLSELRGLEKENARLKRIVAELEPEKLILKESLNHLKPRACQRSSLVRPSSTHARSSRHRSGGPAR